MFEAADSVLAWSDACVLTTGFVALDVVRVPASPGSLFAAGGSCGNVTANLAALGVKTFPVVVLGADEEGRTVYEDLVASGVQMRFIEQRPDVRTPVVIHDVLETSVFGLDHRFVHEAPGTGEPLPRYKSITPSEVDRVIHSGLKFRLLYFDRLSRAVLELVRWAKLNGALTVFEPSEISDGDLFFSVQPLVDVIKFSAQRILPTDELVRRLNNPVRIITKGPAGLTLNTINKNGTRKEFDLPAENPTTVVDSAGAGDAVSTGLICSLVPHGVSSDEELVKGLRAGQKLAALNCSFVGARGIFRLLGANEISKFMQNGALEHIALLKRGTLGKPTLDWTTKPSLETRYR